MFNGPEIWIILLLLLAAPAYFVPSIVAGARKMPNIGSVIVVNVFLGWTFIGWVVALVMACGRKKEIQRIGVSYGVTMFCGRCGVAIEGTQVFCLSCGFQLNGQVSANLAPPVFNGQNHAEVSPDAPKPMGFIETIKFSYKNYARFSGRASRSEYWYFYLYAVAGLFVSSFVGGSIGGFVGAFSGSVNPEVTGLLFYYGFALSTLVPWLARGVRRLHDKNKTGMLLLFGLIPLVGAILLIVWFCSKGDEGPNRFGPAV